MVKDALKLLKSVKDAVESTRAIVEAVNDGKKYLARFHPDARKDVALLLVEVSKTLNGLSKVAAIVGEFQFTGSGKARDMEPSRFNNFVIGRAAEAHDLQDNISDLKGSCTKILKHREALDKRAKDGWSGWPKLLGEKRKKRREELASVLSNLYADDRRIIDLIETLLGVAETGLQEVRVALGTPVAKPANVPKAAKILEQYATQFRPIQNECSMLATELRQEGKALTS